MAALAARMLWPSSVAATTFTGASGRIYTRAVILDVLTADVAAAITAGLLTVGGAGSTSGAVLTGPGTINPAVGTTTAPPQTVNPPGGWAALPNPALIVGSAGGQVTPAIDPNRPAQPIAAGLMHLDAALQKLIISTGTNWVDPVTGQQV